MRELLADIIAQDSFRITDALEVSHDVPCPLSELTVHFNCSREPSFESSFFPMMPSAIAGVELSHAIH